VSALRTEPPPAAGKRAAPSATPAATTLPDSVLPARPPGDPEVRIAEATAKGDWAAAIVAYNEILAAHPDDVAARAGLLEAAQHYREQKAVHEQLEQARRAFADGEYEGALRLLYRMPKGVDPATVEQAKVASWVNLGIVALKAGDPVTAVTQLDEALTLRPQDAEAQRLRTFAQESTGRARDQAYYTRVEGLGFRALD
jgi:tetratricopeptide (TPR) repeat protein